MRKFIENLKNKKMVKKNGGKEIIIELAFGVIAIVLAVYYKDFIVDVVTDFTGNVKTAMTSLFTAITG